MRKKTVFLVLMSISFLSALYATHMLDEVFGETSEPNFFEIAEYYDNRKAVVTVTADDWQTSTWPQFEDMSKMLTAKRIYYTGSIITNTANWTQIQNWLNQGYAEAASHSRTHPSTLPYNTYDSEIGGSKQDIIGNLTLPSNFSSGSTEYVYTWIEPFGQSDITIRQKLGQYKYLADRDTSSDDGWATWDSVNGLFNRIGYSIRMEGGGSGVVDPATLNNKFDSVYNAGGIYHLMTHPRNVNWSPGQYADIHTSYISNRKDVWYVNFGLLYLYHWIDTQNIVQVTPSGSLQDKIFKINMSSTNRQNYGAKYPVTYVFDIPPSWTNAYANYTFQKTDPWTTMETKTPSDFFNGINAVRFDFTNHKAYVSIGFADISNEIYLQILPEDVTPPVTIDDYDGSWHTSDFTINLNATDDLTGVAETYYKINNGPIQNLSTHGQPLITTESANNTLEYWSIDNADNEEYPHKMLTGIKLDKTAPQGSILINNDAANTTTLTVTLNLNASDSTSVVSQMRFSNDGTNWTAWETYTTSRAWNLSSGEGTKTVYAQYKDVAGLVSPTYNDTITFLEDVHSPTTIIDLSGVEGENEWFTSNVNVTLSATDDIPGVDKTEYSFDNATWNTYTEPFTITNEGPTIIYYKSTDKAGNVETTKTQTIKIDKTAPAGSIIINNNDAYTTSTSVTLNLTATDATSDVHLVRYSNDGVWDTEPWETPSPTKTWTLTAGDGAKTVYYQIKDIAGLVSITYPDTIILDTVPPTGSITINNNATYTTTTSVILTLSATDETYDIAKMRFSNDNISYSEWQDYDISQSWILQDGDGTKTVYVQFKDHAGLISTYSDTITLDTSSPMGSILIAEGATYTNSSLVTLTLSATDATSGVAQMRFSNDNVTWSDWEPYNTTKSWTLLAGDGLKSVTVQFRDNAGLSSFYSDSIILDTTKPIANAGVDQTVNEDTLVTFDASASQDENEIQSYIWTFIDVTPQTLIGMNPTYTFATLGTYTITLKVTDPAGNYATDTVTITVLDITKPTANAGPDQTINEDTQITLDGSASTDDVAITTYTWMFTDADTLQTLDGINPTYTFQTPGTYTVTLNVTDAAGNYATDTVIITVSDITNPVADAGPDQTVTEDTMVTFNASQSTDNVAITNYTWTFIDATPQTLEGINPSYNFTTPGTYTVTLTVKDAAGNTATDTVTITVLDITKPTAKAGSDQTINEDTLISFDASGSSDNVGIVSYSWTFTDAGTLQTLDGINPTYTFQTPGTYTVTLNVTDAAGNYATDTVTIIVLDITKPTANAGDDVVVHENTPVTFNASDSTDNVGIVSYVWTFLDETLQTLYGVNATYIFNTPGIYNVTLTVLDAEGNSATDIVRITVVDVTYPLANAGRDQVINEDTMIMFDGSASYDNVGIVSYVWTFLDGTLQKLFGVNPSYTFETPGVYTVTLNVTDAENHFTTDTVVITVKDITPPLVHAGNFATIVEKAPANFDASKSHDNVAIVDYQWDFGDGTLGNSTVPSAIHTYTKLGVYMITLTVMDAAGNVNSTSISVVVYRDTDGDLIADHLDTDDDNDGIPDEWEILHGLNPLDPSDASLDFDGDGLSNLTEYQIGSDPNVYTSPSPFPIFVVLVIIIIGFIIALGFLFMKKL